MARRGLPQMPRGMDVRAQRVWRHVIREMGRSGILAGADADVLRVYCDAVARYELAISQLFATGPVLASRRGRAPITTNPLHRIVRDIGEQIRLLSRELGLSPAARAGLRLDLSSAPSEIDDVIGPPPRLRVLEA